MRPTLLSVLLLAACTDGVGKAPTDTDPSTSDGTAGTNRKPIAEAGLAVTQTADTAVILSGAASTDPDGDTIVFNWSFDHVPAGSALTSLAAPFTMNHTVESGTSFQPDAVGTFVVKLVVQDAKGADSDPDYVVITIETPTNIPVANAGIDQTVNVGATVTMDGSASYDPLGRTLTYSWLLVDKPTASGIANLTNATTVGPTLTPDVKGVYVANLVVNNGLAPSLSDAISITVLGDDHAPTANAGVDQTVEDCTAIALDCSVSADPDNDTLTYLWEVQSKPTGSTVSNTTLPYSFSDRTAARPTFYPDQVGTYVLSCAVNDGATWATPDAVTLTAAERRTNTRPVADGGTNTTFEGGSAVCEESGYTYNCDECAEMTVTLGDTSTASDPDGDPITVSWTVVSGDATITDPTSLVTTVTLEEAEPTTPGECEQVEYEFELEVTDCTGASSTDTLTFIVSCCGVADSG